MKLDLSLGAGQSGYIRQGEPGLNQLIRDLERFGMEIFLPQITALSLEALLSTDEYTALREEYNISYQWFLNMVHMLSPFIELRETPGESSVTVSYTIGVGRAENSILVNALRANEQLESFFSHYDESKVLAICTTNSFSARSLSRIDSYKAAYDQQMKQKSGIKALHNPQFKVEDLVDLVD